MMSGREQRNRRQRRIAGLFCLVAYCFGADIAPDLLAFLCSFDSSHTVHLIRDQSDTRLVLSHENGRQGAAHYQARQDPRSELHRHTFLARMVCSLAPAPAGESDHEALFALGSVPELDGNTSSKARPQTPIALGIATPELVKQFGMPVPRLVERAAHIELLRSLRSTVLLI